MLSYPRVSDMTTPAQASPAFGDLFVVSSVTYVRHAQIKVIPNVLRAPLHSYKSFTRTVVPMHKSSYAALAWMAYSYFPFVVKNHTEPKKELHGTHGYTPAEINHYLGLRPCFAPPLATVVLARTSSICIAATSPSENTMPTVLALPYIFCVFSSKLLFVISLLRPPKKPARAAWRARARTG